MSEENKEKTKIELGDLCPPVKSWFFPSDGSAPYELSSDKKEEQTDGDPAQSA